jgi:F-type H+-transporting ATPase subunit delta
MQDRQMLDIASALVDTAIDEVLLQVAEDMRQIAQVFDLQPAMLRDLSESSVPKEQRVQALRSALEKTVQPVVLNALVLLLEQDLLQEFPAFYEATKNLAVERGNQREVEIISAIPLEERELEEIREKLQKRWKGTIILLPKVDPSILGGLIYRSGSWTYDASLKGRIQRLDKTFAN